MALTRRIGVYRPPKMIVPSAFQLPPRPSDASQILTGAPPPMSRRFNFPSAKKATERLSGDQNGCEAPSVPANICGAVSFSRRSQSIRRLSFAAPKTTFVPSGEKT